MNKRGFDSNATGARARSSATLYLSPPQAPGRTGGGGVGLSPPHPAGGPGGLCARRASPLRAPPAELQFDISRPARARLESEHSPGEAKKVNSSCCARAWENPAPCAWPGLIGARCVWGVCVCVCVCVCVRGAPSSGPGEPRIRGGGGSGAGPRASLPSSPAPGQGQPFRAGERSPQGGELGIRPNTAPHPYPSQPGLRSWGVSARAKPPRRLRRGGGTRVAAAVTGCLTALRKRPGQPPASAQRLRLQRLRAARPPLPPAPSLRPGGRRRAGGRTAGTRRGGCVLPAGRAARREESPPPPPGATWRAPGRERQGSGGGLPGGFAARRGRRALPPAAACLPSLPAPRSSAPCLHPGAPQPLRISRRPELGAARDPLARVLLIPAPSFSRVREAWHTQGAHSGSSLPPPPPPTPNPH
ncbi:uncharacterized protein LOC107400912 [Peromyscus maniculatus bairdii]|uniref:uncharacterized protein LOC107400912 n=1 Tax=Peromyscus maniculatus bairdii TaxID=230844 RepID=UPI003FD56801